MFCCVLCGYCICSAPSQISGSWLPEFRIVYSDLQGTHISGVGLHADPNSTEWNVPSDPGGHWRRVEDSSLETQTIPTMKQYPLAGVHGYLIHDACWTLLARFMSPRPIPVDRFLRLLLSLPFPLRYGGVSWGHDYGGLASSDLGDTYPWEDHFKMELTDSSICTDAKSDPIDIPPSSWSLLPRQRQMKLSLVANRTRDCFGAFPWEIRELIAALLPTTDALRLRLASRSFLRLLNSQTFWLSRFQSTGDRGFLFEARGENKPRDWRALWRAMITPNSEGMRNRKRIWKIIQTVGDLLDLVIAPGQQLSAAICLSQSQMAESVAANVRHEPRTGHFAAFNEGCTVHGGQRMVLPSRISSLEVNTVEIGGTGYISGIRLHYGRGSCAAVGYLSTANSHVLHVACLGVFEVAVGSRGLHALRVRSHEGAWSRWLGDPTNALVTRRLGTQMTFDTLEAGYDGFKLVYLRPVVTSTSASHDQSTKSLRLLHHHALWYPSIPPPHLMLNEQSYTGRSSPASEYSPLFWSQFGGLRGEYLKHLTGISVMQLGQLCSIHFNYDTDTADQNFRRLGRRAFTDFARMINFAIDGPDGEFINSIEVSIEKLPSEHTLPSCQGGKLDSVKFSTSWNRSCHFLPRGKEAKNVILRPLNIQRSTKITGLYGTQHPEFGLTSLGVVSQKLNST